MNSCTGNQAFTLIGFPHSDICGSRDICSSPQLFAAYRVLRRLSVPRHSPCALSNLTFHKTLRPCCYGSLFVDILTLDEVLSKDSLLFHTPLCTLESKTSFLLHFFVFYLSVFLFFMQLSRCMHPYGSCSEGSLVETTRFELVTSCLQGRRSPN